MQTFLDSNLFTWILLPVLIFIARIIDMSLDTMRILMIGRGRKVYAALFGFFEVSIWLLVARQVIAHLPNVASFFAYAGGFAVGNYVGLLLEERMVSGAQMVRIIVNSDGKVIVEALRRAGYGATLISGHGAEGAADIVFSVIRRKDAREVIQLVRRLQPEAFYTIEDVREVGGAFFPAGYERPVLRFLKRR